jgi:hypothetical protein
MFDHRCLWCKAPYLSCELLDDRGACAKQPREKVDGKWVYAPGILAPRDQPEADAA